jgi:hypothetical protein
MSTHHIYRVLPGLALAWLAASPSAAQSPLNHTGIGPRDTVVRASMRYGASPVHRLLLGHNYRDPWAEPVRVPFLDLTRYGGGLRPVKVGGNAQTKNLRLVAPNGAEYVFRPVLKELLVLLHGWEGTIAAQLFADGLSASHPAGPVMAVPFVRAAGVLHPEPVLVVMPNDTLLREFREEFAGKLGTIEGYPNVPDDAPGFGGAVKIEDSEDVLEKLNEDPRQHVDARELLAARMVDMLIGDNDRHPRQWMWARLRSDDTSAWKPIPRDRDKAFVSYDGVLVALARLLVPRLVSYHHIHPRPLFYNAIEFDRRLLAGLDRAEWDSIATALQRAITDSVIQQAMNAVPAGYQITAHRRLEPRIKSRRNELHAAAIRYYKVLFPVADLHATDAAERATIIRSADGVEVRLQGETESRPYFARRFRPGDTREIRLYLHGGDDRAVITGDVARSIPVRIIGGNGTNTILDSSTVAGRRNPTFVYDRGTVEGVVYGPTEVKVDTTKDGVTVDTVVADTSWNRRPWVLQFGTLQPPAKDHGVTLKPIGALKSWHGLGFAPRVGVRRTQYQFRTAPYGNRQELAVDYAFKVNRYRVRLETDNRFEATPLHVVTDGHVSQLELVQFSGFGNQLPDVRHNPFYDARKMEYKFRPALGWALGPESDISLGPIVRYSITDSTPDRFISEELPYGAGRFGQAGVELALRLDTRDNGGFPQRGFLLEATGTAYPAAWDVTRPYEKVSAVASTYLTLPVMTHPVLALRAGGEKIWGDFPYYDAVFLGGRSTVRSFRHHQFAGDASIYGSSELRIPMGRFPWILPWNAGLIGFADAGRVYMDKVSDGGWHTVAGGGFWLGVLNPSTSVTVLFTNRKVRRHQFGIGMTF